MRPKASSAITRCTEACSRGGGTALGWDCRVAGVVDSGVPGPKGNREFFLHLRPTTEHAESDDLDSWIDDAVG